MSANTGSSENTSSLRPTWRSSSQGRGFQPPPAVPTSSLNTNDSSKADAGKNGSSNKNSFSLLDMDDDGKHQHSNTNKKKGEDGGISSSPMRRSSGPVDGSSGSGRFMMSRSEGLRSSGAGSGGFSTRASKMKGTGSGRSLADLASRFTSGSGRAHSHSSRSGGASSGRDTSSGSGIGSNSAYDDSPSSGGGTNSRMSSFRGDLIDDKNIVRYTRERLLSMRPRPDKDTTPPSSLNCLDGTPLLSKEPLDPVCWDNFDANEIWAQAGARERPSRANKQPSTGGRDRKDVDRDERRGSMSHESGVGVGGGGGNNGGIGGGGGGAWRRGVALPPEGSARRNSSRYDDIADSPEDLWDDPSAPQMMGAAADFSAFGGALDDEPLKVVDGGGDAFDLAHMSEAARKFEEEIRGGNSGGKASTNGLGATDENGHVHSVNPTRPLASEGTTIRSGSGDDVNVFEDFGDPDSSGSTATAAAASTKSAKNERPVIKSGDEQTPSSRLMQMIGVTNDENGADVGNKNQEEQEKESAGSNVKAEPAASLFNFSSGVSKNPWGASSSANNAPQESFGGLDLAAKLRESTVDQIGMQGEAERLKRDEMERIRLMEAEEEKRRSLRAQQQQQAELILRQQQQAAAREQQQKQAQQGPSQIELILTERISTILENSWGRADLISVLSTLHNEDSRVVPLLGTVDALRALVARHPRRFALAKDPSFGTEMAVLLMNNATWQQQKQAEELQRRQQEEHQKMLAAQQEAARVEAQSRAKNKSPEPVVITDRPWYYADPQRNVQGPFGGEEMRQWLEAGYFQGDLPISQDPKGPFRTLSSIFPDIAVAFKPTGPSQKELAAIAEAEKEARLKAEATAEAAAVEAAAAAAAAEDEARKAAEREKADRERTELEARAKAEKEAALAAAKAAEDLIQQQEKESQSNQNQSAQLKMLLGLGGGSSSVVGGITKETPEQNEPVIASSEQSEPQPQSKLSKSKEPNKTNGAVEAQSQSSPVPAPASAPTPVPASVPVQASAPAWGGAGTNKMAVQRKSMSEIQKEEAKVAARVAKTKPQNSGGWANIAASGGTTAWSGNASVISAAPVSIINSSNSQANTSINSRTKQTPGAMTQKPARNQSSTQKTMEEFGANDKMTPVLENWCKDQMRKLSGNDDLTLIAFCMTLSDPVEIKGYLTAYLGSSPQVNNFSDEFISRKNGTKQQEQWETTGGSKKGRKKKNAVGK